MSKLFSTKNLIRLLWLLVIVLAITAGYFQAALETERRESEYLRMQLDQESKNI